MKYFLLLIIGVIVLLFTIREVGAGEFWKIAKLIVYFMIVGSILWGLRIKSRWVIPFILIISAFGVLNCFLNMFSPAENIEDLFVKLIVFLFLVFFAYQLKFFTCKSVKSYFDVKGHIFF